MVKLTPQEFMERYKENGSEDIYINLKEIYEHYNLDGELIREKMLAGITSGIINDETKPFQLSNILVSFDDAIHLIATCEKIIN